MIKGVALKGRSFQPRRKAQPSSAALTAEVYSMAKAMPLQIPLQTIPISLHA
jgi:hypothetical protein